MRGVAVEAIVGGVFHQFVRLIPSQGRHGLNLIQGGSAAHRLFHTRILPILASAQTLPLSKEMRTAIDDMCEQFGGRRAPIIPPTEERKPTTPNQLHQIEQRPDPEVVEGPRRQQRRLYGR